MGQGLRRQGRLCAHRIVDRQLWVSPLESWQGQILAGVREGAGQGVREQQGRSL